MKEILNAKLSPMPNLFFFKSSRHKREVNVVCYGELGCFEDSGPYGYIDMLPSSPEEIDTQFYVYSTRNR
jgi:triacylglycerol lipase